VDGLTGRLTLDNERRVQRELAWAQLHDGVTRPAPVATATPGAPLVPTTSVAQ
jgi:hypothetical protein